MHLSASVLRINRNIVECKCILNTALTTSNNVLIETLWNVNLFEYILNFFAPACINRNIVECKYIKYLREFETVIAVLIETLWNVNSKTILFQNISHIRINRNIVECK